MCRLRKNKHAIKANPDSPTLSPPIKPVEKVNVLSKRQENDLMFDRLQKLLTKKIEALNANRDTLLTIDYIPAHNLSPLPNQKRGIMDNIGKIFDCSYDLPARPSRNFNAD